MIWSLIAKNLPVILLGLAIVGGLFYVQNLRDSVAQLTEKNDTLTQLIEDKDIQIEQNDMDQAQIQDLSRKIDTKFQNSENQLNELSEKFNQSANGEERDFPALVDERPEILERLINRGTRYALRCNEIVSGSPVLESDASNNICPGLVK